MGARRYGQEGALANPTPSGNVVQCFCALVVTEKRSLDELFMRYFHNLSSASGAKAPRPPPGLYPWIRWGDFIPRLLICPLLEKILRAPMSGVSGNLPPGSVRRVKNIQWQAIAFVETVTSFNSLH